jgi:hypothetical protein
MLRVRLSRLSVETLAGRRNEASANIYFSRFVAVSLTRHERASDQR